MIIRHPKKNLAAVAVSDVPAPTHSPRASTEPTSVQRAAPPARWTPLAPRTVG